jgi:phosphomannomutase
MEIKEPVKFGTDGWRAVIGDTYTFHNVRRVALATARVFKNHPKIQNGIIIGYDTRFLSKEFAHAAAEVFGNEGIKVQITDSFVTTPTVSLLSRNENLAFGVMITASHNPFQYNGYKLKDEFGGSMSPDELVKIEAELKNIPSADVLKDFNMLMTEGTVKYFNGREYFINYLRNKIDVNKIKEANINAAYDAMFGAGQNVISELLPVTQLHAEINPSFGKTPPEPVEKNLGEVMELVKIRDFDLGIVTDGDADRIAIIDENGDFLDAQKTFALLLMYLNKVKGLGGKVVRSFSASEIIDKYCRKYNLELETVPIGFKYISKIMINEDVLIGAEESGGIGIKGHLPERDGVFNGLMYMEMIAATGKSIGELRQELENEFGKYFYKRIDVHTTDELKNATLAGCAAVKAGGELAGNKVLSVNDLDGYKFMFENGWLLVRASGTEPLLRFYCETYDSDQTLNILESSIKNFNL